MPWSTRQSDQGISDHFGIGLGVAPKLLDQVPFVRPQQCGCDFPWIQTLEGDPTASGKLAYPASDLTDGLVEPLTVASFHVLIDLRRIGKSSQQVSVGDIRLHQFPHCMANAFD